MNAGGCVGLLVLEVLGVHLMGDSHCCHDLWNLALHVNMTMSGLTLFAFVSMLTAPTRTYAVSGIQKKIMMRARPKEAPMAQKATLQLLACMIPPARGSQHDVVSGI